MKPSTRFSKLVLICSSDCRFLFTTRRKAGEASGELPLGYRLCLVSSRDSFKLALFWVYRDHLFKKYWPCHGPTRCYRCYSCSLSEQKTFCICRKDRGTLSALAILLMAGHYFGVLSAASLSTHHDFRYRYHRGLRLISSLPENTTPGDHFFGPKMSSPGVWYTPSPTPSPTVTPGVL